MSGVAPSPGGGSPRGAIDSSSHGPADPGRRRDLLIVGYSHAGQHAYVAGVGIAIPFVVSAFHVSYALVGVLLAVATMTGSLWQLAAAVVRRFSSRLLLAGQDVGSTIGAVVGAVSPGIALFFVGRLVQAWSTWPQHPIGSAYLGRRHPKAQGSLFSWHVTAGNLGTLIAPLAVTGVIASGGWRWGFWLLAALLASSAVVVSLGVEGPWRPRPRSGAEEAAKTRRLAWSSFVALVRQRPVAVLLAAGCVAAGGQGIGILSVYLPSYLKSGLHVHAFALGAVMTVVYVGAVIGPVLMGHISDRAGHRGVLIANYVLGSAAILGVVGAQGAVVVIAAVGLAVGIFSYSELPLRQTLFSDYLRSEDQRAGFGVFFAVSQSIGAAWVAIIGILVTTVGFRGAFMAMAASFLAAGGMVVAGTHRVRAVPDQQ